MDDEPPTMNAGFPANLVCPPSSHGAGKLTDLACGWWFQIATNTVTRAAGTDAA